MRVKTIVIAAALVVAIVWGCSKSGDSTPNPSGAGLLAYRGESAGGSKAGPGAVQGTGWGTIKGQFVFAGSPPSLGNLSTGGKDSQQGDQERCDLRSSRLSHA